MSVITGPTASEFLQRLEDVADLYAAQAVSVRRLVGLNVHACDAVIEDACQVAWTRLVHHRARVRRDGATRWLVRVAVHEAFKLIRRNARDLSLEQLLQDGGGDGAVAAAGALEELAEQRARLEAIRSLPARQQQLVWLQGLGFSYEEMAGETGATRRTVERQLLRARGALAQAQA